MPTLMETILQALWSILPFLWPVLLSVALLWLIWGAVSNALPRRNTLEWVELAARPPRLTLPDAQKFFHRRDAVAMGVITAVYAVIAFLYLGDNQAPQTFVPFTQTNDAVTITLFEPVAVTDVVYYTGLGHNSTPGDGYELAFSTDGESWTPQGAMSHNHGELFRWRKATLLTPGEPVRYIRITAQSDMSGRIPHLELGEIALYAAAADGTFRVRETALGVNRDDAWALFDESFVIPSPPEAGILNGSHFDEIYHARTAYEHNLGRMPYEITHPPLGKLLIGLGIRVFGMTPFGWRFIGTLFGVLMVPVFYLLARRMFPSTFVASCSTLLFTFDFMHFVQTRISTIDVYGVFFILLMYLFMVIYVTGGLGRPFEKTMLPLFLCGLSFGLGIAAKWISFYAALGLIALLLLYLARRCRYAWNLGNTKAYWRFLGKTLLWCIICFVVIPAVIYTLCYIPYAAAEGKGGFTWGKMIDEMWRNQRYMFTYHKGTNTPHAYESNWYQWILNQRPILYWMSTVDGLNSRVAAFLNPVTCWGGLGALFFCGWHFFKYRRWQPLIILIGYLSQLAPWFLITRTTFAYHYFPSMIFLALALGFVFQVYRERAPKSKLPVILTAAAVLLFALFYPALSGFPYSDSYAHAFLRWLPTWPV